MSARSRAYRAGADHWDAAYSTRGVDGVSWYQAVPALSLELVDALGVSSDAAVIDVGGGASLLVDELLARGYRDVTVLDLSGAGLEAIRRRIPADAPVQFVHTDLLEWEPDRRYDLWHDRAVFHFLVAASDRDRYLATLRRAMAPGGTVIVGTFAEDGPETCSGLPVSRYSASDLTAALGEAFDVLETRREQHVTPRGAVQPFAWVAGSLSATHLDASHVWKNGGESNVMEGRMAVEVDIDVDLLKSEIKKAYASVSQEPEKDFIFPTGRAWAEDLQYPEELANVPDSAAESFAGVANPWTLGRLAPGERVLDLGSGAGTDSLIAAQMVGATGSVTGIDMTPEMLAKARSAAAEMGASNVEFIETEAETLPFPDESFDVVVSNGVIDLIPDKDAVFAELFRVLVPGGRMQIADVTIQNPVSDEGRRNIDLWTG